MMVQGGEVVSYERGIPVGFGVCLGLEGEADILDGIAAPRNAEHSLLFQPSLVQGFQAPVVFVCVCVCVCVCTCFFVCVCVCACVCFCVCVFLSVSVSVCRTHTVLFQPSNMQGLQAPDKDIRPPPALQSHTPTHTPT